MKVAVFDGGRRGIDKQNLIAAKQFLIIEEHNALKCQEGSNTFCLTDLLTTYITSSKDKSTFMLTSILQLFENELITAIIQSIRIIYIKITAPFFSLASRTNLHWKWQLLTTLWLMKKSLKISIYF